jgi:predicted transcriptional regulator
MPRLGELERSAMNVLWDAPTPLTVREVLDALGERDLAYTTIMTVLDRLGAKDMVRRERDGRAYRTAPAMSRDAATSELLHAALDEAGSDRRAALVHFAHTVDPDEAQALRDALDEIVARNPQ